MNKLSYLTALKHSGNSLVGTHLMAATLRQLGRICQVVYANLDWDKAKSKLVTAIRVAFATRYIQRTKVTLIGYQAPGFVDFHPNPFEMSRRARQLANLES